MIGRRRRYDEDSFTVKENTQEDERADAIAAKLGYAKVGIIFNITTTKERAYTLSAFEVRTMAKYQAMHGENFVTAVVMMLEDEDEGPQVSFEPFQVSDQCVKLYSEGWFHDEPAWTTSTHHPRVQTPLIYLLHLALPTSVYYIHHRVCLHLQGFKSRERIRE